MPLTESVITQPLNKRKTLSLSDSNADAQDEPPKKLSGYQLLRHKADYFADIAEQKDIEIKKLTQQLADEKDSIAAAKVSAQNASNLSIEALRREFLAEKASNKNLTKRNTELSAQMVTQSIDLEGKIAALAEAKDNLQKHETTMNEQRKIIVKDQETITHYKNVSWGSIMAGYKIITEQRDDHIKDQQTISKLEQESALQHAEIVKLKKMLEAKAEAAEHAQDSKSLLRSPPSPFPFWTSQPQLGNAINSTSTASSMPYLDLTEEDTLDSFKL